MKKKYYLPLIVLFAIILISLPFILRLSNNFPLFAGSEFYYDARASLSIVENQYYDSLQNRFFSLTKALVKFE